MMCRPKGGRSQPRYHNVKRAAEEKYFRAIEERREVIVSPLSQTEIYIMALEQMAMVVENEIDKIRRRK